ncbi:MAG: hypothetical protein CVV25_01285 [Ignavibacteriae bacterium HGW-Ignavibacteriae-4]|jgi:hypothetical protein|nr:MAG: hypothetical protein CVV25_01285 [Ignavibacteriae bacterium HGW-Ignavibacteriae-4]
MVRTLSFIIIIFLTQQLHSDSTDNKTIGYQLKNIEKGWNRLELDDELLMGMSSINTFIKVKLVNKSKDTLEIPYVIESSKQLDSTIRIPVEIVNKTIKDGKKYYTLIADSTQIISNLEFSFSSRNSLGKASLEGSNNQKEWFMISDSLLLGERQNSHQKISSKTIYDLQTLYLFYRLSLEDTKSKLESVFYEKTFSANPKYKKLNVNQLKYRTDKDKKRTIYRFSLNGRLPIHYLMLDIQNKFDYNRTVNLFGLVDSTKTRKGTKHNYKLIETFQLNSMDSTNYVFSFPEHYEHYKIVILNGNDPPLKIGRLTAYRHEYILKARFDDEGDAFIKIRNSGSFPYYDIDKFKSRIPTDMNEMKLGDKLELEISKAEIEPLITNKLWLWLVMMLAVIVIGYFSLKMLNEEKKK